MTKSKSFSEFVLNDLKTDDDIKEWINIGFQEFLQDNDLNAFVKALEYAVKAKDTISGISKKTGISRSNLYAIFNGEQKPQLTTALKIIKEIRFDCGRSSSKAFGHKVVERILSLLQNNDELTPEDIKYLVSKIN